MKMRLGQGADAASCFFCEVGGIWRGYCAAQVVGIWRVLVYNVAKGAGCGVYGGIRDVCSCEFGRIWYMSEGCIAGAY